MLYALFTLRISSTLLFNTGAAGVVALDTVAVPQPPLFCPEQSCVTTHLFAVATGELVDAARLVTVVDWMREHSKEHDKLLLGVFLALQRGMPRVLVKFVNSHGNQAHGHRREKKTAHDHVRRHLAGKAVLEGVEGTKWCEYRYKKAEKNQESRSDIDVDGLEEVEHTKKA